MQDGFEKATGYHEAALELASEAKNRESQFTDKERMSLEIYAERQDGSAKREKYLEMARSESHPQQHESSMIRGR